MEWNFVIRSNHAGDELAFGRGGGRDWEATLRVGGLEATLDFYELESESFPADLGKFFSRLARRWRGWEGECYWETLEGNVALRATHDGLGTVELRVLLKRELGWLAEASLFVDAGALDRLARKAKAA